MPQVNCSVSNCSFWEQGNKCNAAAIMIDIDEHAHAKYDAEFAGEFGTAHKDSASKVSNTCCHTFERKSK